MATNYTDAQRRAAYIRFETAADRATRGGAANARSRAAKRWTKLPAAEKLQLGDAMLIVDDAEGDVQDREAQVEGWEPDTRTLPAPTTADQRNAQDAFIDASQALRDRLTQLQALQQQLRARNVAMAWTDHLLADADALQSRLEAAQRAQDGQTTPPGTPAIPVPALPQDPPCGSPVGAGWVGSWRIGSGGFGSAHLWVRQDHNGRIINRVVAKDSYHNEKLTIENWRRRWFWSKDRKGELIPTEIKALYDLRGRRGSEYVVQILGWKKSILRKMHRQYLEHCPGGSAWRLYSRDAYLKAENFIPEPFLWYCAEALATVGLIMLYGDSMPNPVVEWRPILHRDLTISNIFLGDKQPHFYAAYPVPKVADFGLSAYNLRDGDHTVERDGRVGTLGSTAPEQHRADDDLGPQTSKSDVWSVGCCLMSLMLKVEGYPKYQGQDMAFDPFESRFEQIIWDDAPYSEELRGLVEDCMSWMPDERLTFPQLLKRIREARARHNENLHLEREGGPAWNDTNKLQWSMTDYLRTGEILRTELATYEQMRRDKIDEDDPPEYPVSVPAPPGEDSYGEIDDVEMGGVAGADVDP